MVIRFTFRARSYFHTLHPPGQLWFKTAAGAPAFTTGARRTGREEYQRAVLLAELAPFKQISWKLAHIHFLALSQHATHREGCKRGQETVFWGEPLNKIEILSLRKKDDHTVFGYSWWFPSPLMAKLFSDSPPRFCPGIRPTGFLPPCLSPLLFTSFSLSL